VTLKEKVQIYERFFHQIQMHYAVTMRQDKVLDALNIIDAWSYSHRVGNGQYSEQVQQKCIDKITERMREFV